MCCRKWCGRRVTRTRSSSTSAQVQLRGRALLASLQSSPERTSGSASCASALFYLRCSPPCPCPVVHRAAGCRSAGVWARGPPGLRVLTVCSVLGCVSGCWCVSSQLRRLQADQEVHQHLQDAPCGKQLRQIEDLCEPYMVCRWITFKVSVFAPPCLPACVQRASSSCRKMRVAVCSGAVWRGMDAVDCCAVFIPQAVRDRIAEFLAIAAIWRHHEVAAPGTGSKRAGGVLLCCTAAPVY